MRIRIALMTAMAVLVVPSLLFTLVSSTPAAAARARHEHRHRAVKIHSRLASRSGAQKAAESKRAAELASFDSAITKALEENYLKEYAFLKESAFLKGLAAQQAAAAAAQQAAAQQAAAQQAAAQQAAATAAAAAPSAPLPAPAAGGSDATSTNTPDWACIRQHESNDNYGEGGGGAYQFELGTWQSLTGLSTPAEDSPPAVQDAAALLLFSQRGWEPWSTRFVCGL